MDDLTFVIEGLVFARLEVIVRRPTSTAEARESALAFAAADPVAWHRARCRGIRAARDLRVVETTAPRASKDDLPEQRG